MKTKTVILISAALVMFVPIGAYAQGKYLPKPNEELCKTWENVNTYPQKTVQFVGGYKDYDLITDPTPTGEGIEQIMKKWTDADGNIWYWTFGKITVGRYAGVQWQCLSKISHNGTLKEEVVVAPAYEFDPNNPAELDPGNRTYRVYYLYGN